MAKAIFFIVFFISFVCTSNASWAASDSSDSKTLFQKDSIYQTLEVRQSGTVLELYGGRTCFSAMDKAEPYRHVLEYTGMMIMGTGYVENPKTALLIGLGGGTVANYMRKYYPDMKITVVELDKTVLECSQKFFDFKTGGNMKAVLQDGRRFLMKDKEKFDIIFLDAYYGDYIPFHLLTKEFLVIVKDHLQKNGIVVSNTWSSQKLYERESATYETVFGHFDSYLGVKSGNRIIITSGNGEKSDEPTLRSRMVKTQETMQFKELNLPELFDKTYDRNLEWPKDTQILTDDFAPVNSLVEESDKVTK
jgi:spermidine synthase